MATPWQKLRDNIAARTALEGLLLFDDAVQGLTDAQTQGSSTNQYNPVNARAQQALEPHHSPKLSFDSDELRIDLEDDLELGEEGDGILDEGLAEDIELDDLPGLEEFDELEDLERDIDDFERGLLADMDIDSPGSIDEFQLENDSIGAGNYALLDAILPSWEEPDDASGDDFDNFNEDDAEADILMGMLVMGMAEEVAHMRGPYGQIPTSQDWFSVSMQWKGDRFRRMYR